MFLQVEIATKTLSTHLTREGLCFIVSVHVKCEVVDLMKGFATLFTFEALFVTMSELVIFVVTFLVKTLTTKLTDVWLVSLMDSGVSIKG